MFTVIESTLAIVQNAGQKFSFMPFEAGKTSLGARGARGASFFVSFFVSFFKGISFNEGTSFDSVETSAFFSGFTGRKETAFTFFGRRASGEGNLLPPASKIRIFLPGLFLCSSITHFSYRRKEFDQ
jgi:hypothetical protein